MSDKTANPVMVGRYPWDVEMAIISSLLRWVDTASEVDPVGFWIVIGREGAKGNSDIVVQCRFRSPAIKNGELVHCQGRGRTPEQALVDLAERLVDRHNFVFSELTRARGGAA